MDIINIPVEKIDPHPDNPRGKITKASVAELAESIRVHGLLQPLVVRLQGKERFTLLAGHRRLAALKTLNGIETVPAILHDAEATTSPESADGTSILITDNAQHVSPDAIKEAELVAGMDEDLSIEEIAGTLSKSVAWVSQRRALSKLSKRWRACLKGSVTKGHSHHPLKDAPLWLLLEVTRLAPPAQDILFLDWDQHEALPSRRAAQDAVAQMTCSLAAAIWPLDATEVEGAGVSIPPCRGCEKHSLSLPGLFKVEDPADLAHAICRDAVCFDQKMNLVLWSQVAVLVKKQPDLKIMAQNIAVPEEYSQRIVTAWALTKCKKADDHAVPVVTVRMGGLSRVSYMRPQQSQSAEVNGARRRARPIDQETGKPVPTPMKERRANLKRRRQVRCLKIAATVVRGDRKAAVGEKVADKKLGSKAYIYADAPEGKVPTLSYVLHKIMELGTGHGLSRRDGGKDTVKNPAFFDPKENRGIVDDNVHRTLWYCVTDPLANTMKVLGGETPANIDTKWKEAVFVLKAMGVDAETIFVEAVDELPEPASWANLNADGTPKNTRKAPDGTPKIVKKKASGKAAAKARAQKGR